jgi:hypothetical protein|tara:strand:- start:29 stop:220 length:192 start_codon:yes stop_codon:yes gene_type:complete
MNDIKRGDRIWVKHGSVPEGALGNGAVVLLGGLSDTKGTFHKVMFNAGEQGIIISSIPASEIV